MVQQTWIKERRKMNKIFDKKKKIFDMKNWKTVLIAEWKHQAEVKIQWGIFQVDSLPSLPLVIDMIPLNGQQIYKITRKDTFLM